MAVTTELTDLKCRKAVPGPKPYKIAAGGALFLLVMPSGGKLWRWKYRFDGKEKEMALGKYPDIPLARVRVLHAEARALLASGTDPMAIRKESKEQKKAERNPVEKEPTLTFEKLTRLWFAKWKEDKAIKHAEQIERYLEQDVLPFIGSKDPAHITPKDLVPILHRVEGRGAREIAQRTLGYIRRIYRWGKSNFYLDKEVVNPAVDIDSRDVFASRSGKKQPHLEIGEVGAFLRTMQKYEGFLVTKIFMELQSLTFVRSGELRKAKWKEIDWENRRWNLPKEHMKIKKFPHIVPLSEQAIVILKRLYAFSGSNEMLFPSPRGGEKNVLDAATGPNAIRIMGYQGRMTGHGWRHIASTFLRNNGFDKYWVEAQLAHVEGGVAGVYNEAEYIDDRTRMMQFWADALDKMRESEV
jgi:integrase